MSLIGRAMAWPELRGAARAAGHNNTEVGQCYVSRQRNTTMYYCVAVPTETSVVLETLLLVNKVS